MLLGAHLGSLADGASAWDTQTATNACEHVEKFFSDIVVRNVATRRVFCLIFTSYIYVQLGDTFQHRM